MYKLCNKYANSLFVKLGFNWSAEAFGPDTLYNSTSYLIWVTARTEPKSTGQDSITLNTDVKKMFLLFFHVFTLLGF